MSKRTKGPWFWDDSAICHGYGIIARLPNLPENRKNWNADAAAIVLWENNFDALVRALEKVVQVSKSGSDTVSFLVEINDVAKICSDVLAKVKP